MTPASSLSPVLLLFLFLQKNSTVFTCVCFVNPFHWGCCFSPPTGCAPTGVSANLTRSQLTWRGAHTSHSGTSVLFALSSFRKHSFFLSLSWSSSYLIALHSCWIYFHFLKAEKCRTPGLSFQLFLIAVFLSINLKAWHSMYSPASPSLIGVALISVLNPRLTYSIFSLTSPPRCSLDILT